MMVKNLHPKKPSAVNGGRTKLDHRAEERGAFRQISGALVLSALAHGMLVVALLIVASYFSQARLAFNPVYTVNLVDLPAGEGSSGRALPPEVPQPQAKKPEPPPQSPPPEKPPEPKSAKPAPPPPKPKPEIAKPEMTLPMPKAKEPPKQMEKKPEPPARQAQPTPEPPKKPPPNQKREPDRPVARGTGAPGAGISAGGGVALGTGGGSVSLDTLNFPFTFYLRQVTERIEQNWVRPQENVGRVVVYFRISRDGTIGEPQVYESSRDRVVDLLAAGAVKRSDPFPPLPVEFEGDHLGIYLCFGMGAICPGQRQG